MGFLEHLQNEERTSSLDSNLSDGSIISTATTVAPKSKTRSDPNEQAIPRTMSEDVGE